VGGALMEGAANAAPLARASSRTSLRMETP
jgi:hypothetical protein